MLVPLNARLCVLQRIPIGGCGAEIGVHNGDYSLSLVTVAKPKKLYLIDPWIASSEEQHSKSLYARNAVSQAEMDKRHDRVAARFAAFIKKGSVEIIREKSGSAAERILDNSLDYVYIDGDHTYEGVKSDLAKFWPKVKFGGLLICDDYTLGGWWKEAVVRAVHEFLARRDSKVDFVIDTQFCIRKINSH